MTEQEVTVNPDGLWKTRRATVTRMCSDEYKRMPNAGVGGWARSTVKWPIVDIGPESRTEISGLQTSAGTRVWSNLPERCTLFKPLAVEHERVRVCPVCLAPTGVRGRYRSQEYLRVLDAAGGSR
jgi:hypothetical protein